MKRTSIRHLSIKSVFFIPFSVCFTGFTVYNSFVLKFTKSSFGQHIVAAFRGMCMSPAKYSYV